MDNNSKKSALETAAQLKAAIVYFSGTGNTFRVGEVFKDYLESMNYKVDMVDINNHKEKLQNYDLYIIGSPTYTYVSHKSLPVFIDKYINSDDNPKAHFITYATHSWEESFGHLTLKKYLTKKGFQVSGSRAFKTPNNFYYFASQKHSEEETYQLYLSVKKNVNGLLNLYFKGLEQIDPILSGKKIPYLMPKLLDKILMPSFARKSFKIDNDKCNQCKLCVKKCPNDNIEIKNGEITFSNQCLGCSKCIHICPKNAYLFKEKSIEQYDLKQPSILEQLKLA
jgi:Pyruvate/2-oxoacid:ferredoxin oxidoreductase delta subunit/flavodoxin